MWQILLCIVVLANADSEESYFPFRGYRHNFLVNPFSVRTYHAATPIGSGIHLPAATISGRSFGQDYTPTLKSFSDPAVIVRHIEPQPFVDTQPKADPQPLIDYQPRIESGRKLQTAAIAQPFFFKSFKIDRDDIDDDDVIPIAYGRNMGSAGVYSASDKSPFFSAYRRFGSGESLENDDSFGRVNFRSAPQFYSGRTAAYSSEPKYRYRYDDDDDLFDFDDK